MPVQTSKKYLPDLNELLDRIDEVDEVVRDRWLGKRTSPRYALNIPVVIQVLTDNRVGPPVEYPLRDISDNGICFISKINICHGTWLRAQIEVNEACWSGNLCVAHCTETVGGFKVGADQAGPLGRKITSDPSHEITSSIQSRLREMESLKAIAEEIQTVIRAYDIARLSWGLLGTSLKKKILSIVRDLPPVADAPVEQCRRKHPRKVMCGCAQLIVKTNYGRKRIDAKIINVSEGGGCLQVRNSALEDPIERKMAGDLLIQPETTLMLGIGGPDEMLWIPAEIRRMQKLDKKETEIGIQFVTDKSLSSLKGHI
ncbi:MAG: PilZ domain-containing protein [Phycisphaerales bacterium]|nr:PilZ domain-containing protein [Phycisphaerales bacterium]